MANLPGQSSVISVVIIAGIVIAMVGVAYAWAVPVIEKRITVTDYNLIEGFMAKLSEEIVEVANSGSGESRIPIPKGAVTVLGYDYAGPVNNTIFIDFEVSQPIMIEGSVPILTSSLGEVAEYGKTEPRIITLSRSEDSTRNEMNMSMYFRELRSQTPKGYISALCPAGASMDCSGISAGAKEVVVSFSHFETMMRSGFDGGDLTITYVTVAVS